MNKYALIVAGGSGTRLPGPVPKQFLELRGLPVLMHTLQAFHRAGDDITLILVLPEACLEYWRQLCEVYNFRLPHTIAPGGKTRFQSVKNGLRHVDRESLVAVHDGVRPLVSATLIQRCYEAARKHGSGVAAVPPKDSLRQLTASGSRHVDRQQYRLMQTPQTFRSDILLAAYARVRSGRNFTDDASVAEAAGHRIRLVEGEYANLKITTPEDLAVAQALLENG